MDTKLTSSAKVPVGDLNFRWVDGYHDGVLSGFAIWQEKLCYFQVSDATTEARRFSLHSLSLDEATAALREHENFKERHGTHNDLLPDGSSAGGTCITTLEECAAAGDAYAAGKKNPTSSYHMNPVVGWFTSTSLLEPRRHPNEVGIK